MKIEYTGCCFRFLFETFSYRALQLELRALKRNRAHALRRELLRSLREQVRRRNASE